MTMVARLSGRRASGRSPAGVLPCWCAALIAVALPLVAGGCSSRVPDREALVAAGRGSAEQGRAIVERAVEAHGGRGRWDALEDVRFTLRDTWHGLASLGTPWPEDDVRLSLTYHFGLAKGRVEFPDAPGRVWGFDSVEGWKLEDGQRRYDGIPDVTFVVPTVAYFLALPFKLLDDGVLLFDAGPAEHEGRTFDTVLATFEAGVGAVQDRYRLYFDPGSGRLAYTTFTVREQGDLLEGDARYVEWQDAAGLVLPARVELGGIRPVEVHAHTLVVDAVEVVPGFDRSGYEKPSDPQP